MAEVFSLPNKYVLFVFVILFNICLLNRDDTSDKETCVSSSVPRRLLISWPSTSTQKNHPQATPADYWTGATG